MYSLLRLNVIKGSYMPIIKSAKKRVRTAEKAAIRNSKTKRSLKGAIKAFQQALGNSDKKTTAAAHSKAQSALDKAAKKNVMHKNKVARKQSQLAKAAKKAAGVDKPAAKTSTTKAAPKTAAKPKTAVKATAKKAAPAKKPAVKKAALKTPKK